MNFKTMDFPMEFKTIGDTGEFDGYAGIFNNKDLERDVVKPGAFKQFDLTKDGMVRVLNQHNVKDPIGKAHVKEDSAGLHFDGKLVLEVPSARTMYSLIKAGIIDGMSYGYDVLAGGFERTRDNGRVLSGLKLWEISPVTFGANPLARIEGVKAANNIKTIREFEEFLRDEGGFSHQQAKDIAIAGWKSTEPARDEPGGDEVRSLIDVLSGFSLQTN